MAQQNQGKQQRSKGVCKRFNNEKGFGFIACDDGSGDVFVHQTEVYADGFRSLAEGEALEFDIQIQDDGRRKAVNVTGPNGAFVKGAQAQACLQTKQLNPPQRQQALEQHWAQTIRPITPQWNYQQLAMQQQFWAQRNQATHLQRYDQPQQAYASSTLGHHFSPMSVQPSLQHVYFQPVRQVQQPMYGQPPLSYGQPLPSQPMNVSWNMPQNGAPLMGGHPAVVQADQARVLQARPQGAHGPTRPPLTRLTRARINTQLYANTADANAKQPQSPLTAAGTAPSPLMQSPEIVSVSPASSRPPSSRQFTYANNSNTAHSTVSDDAAISSRFSLSSALPSVPSALTAHRDIYDFRLTRNAANIHHTPQLVTRQLREMPLRNTLSLGLQRADTSPSADN